ncbi:MAG: sugar porter family MFS transporter [Solirubrobacterales bacterium]
MVESAASSRHAKRNVYVTAAIAGLAGLLFGYDTGIIAGALLSIQPEFGLGSFASGMVVGAVPVGAVAGAWFASSRGDLLGRRTLILVSAGVFIVGAIGSAVADSALLLIIARVVIGLGIGVASAITPVYISEIAPPDIRGGLVTFFQLAVTIGILVAYLVGLAFTDVGGGWRWMLGLGAVPALVLALGVVRLPRSPRWLIMTGDEEGAKEALARIRTGGPEEISREVADIRSSLGEEKGASWRDLLQPVVKAALVVGIGLAVLQQITGINTVIYYAPTIIQQAGIGSDSSAILASLGVGVINVLMTVVALRLLDRAGRRTMLFIGVSGMSLSLFLLGAAFLGSGTFTSVIAIVSLMLFVSSFAISLGPIFWLLNAEIYPLNVRSKAASAGTMTNWFFNFLVSLTFLPLIDLLTQSGAFWFYGLVGLVTLWFCWKFVPETKGRSLEQITAVFERRAGRQDRGAAGSP